MFNKKPIIKFGSMYPFLEIPSSAKRHVPDWYKKSPKFIDNGSCPVVATGETESNLGVKTCIPFLDSLTTGYIATLWQDVKVEIINGNTEITWPTEPSVLNGRSPRGMHTLPIPHGHSDAQYLWLSPFVIQTPPGYSVMISHPFNRFDLPFTTLSAVVDSDGILQAGHMPFYLKEGFEGVIEAGTPIYQIVPFKREPWSSKEDPSLKEANKKRQFESTRKLMGDYKNRIWSRKTYD